jgi:hypothetical protein
MQMDERGTAKACLDIFFTNFSPDGDNRPGRRASMTQRKQPPHPKKS